jgi:hypothetical protein
MSSTGTSDATVTYSDLAVCVDCAMMLANGELGQGDAEAVHASLIEAQWPDTFLTLSGSEDEDTWFSSSPCDGCGSQLAGDRFSAVAMSS